MTKTKPAQLLRCPHCGGKPAVVSVANGYFVACTECPAQSGSYSHTFTSEAAIAHWNRRRKATTTKTRTDKGTNSQG
ncbi:MAG: Lar family restriction alleviation protein [Pyrinomonadaceae bacterium]